MEISSIGKYPLMQVRRLLAGRIAQKQNPGNLFPGLILHAMDRRLPRRESSRI